MSARHVIVTLGLVVSIAAAPARSAAAANPDDVWAAFLIAFHNAGKEGVASARDVLADQRAQLMRLDRDEMVAALEKAVRDAKFVDEAIDEGLRGARGFVRFTYRGRPVSGKVVEVTGRGLRLRTAVGKQVDLARAELSPQELARASGLVRYKLATAAQLGAYYLARGETDAAKAILGGDASNDAKRATYAALAAQIAGVTAKKPEPPAKEEDAPPAEAAPVAAASPERAKRAARVPRTGGPYEPDALTVLLLHFDEETASPTDSSPAFAECVEAKDVTRVTGGAARHGSALSFNGHSSSVFMRSEGELSLREPALTIEAWVNQHDRFAGNLGAQDIVTQGDKTGYHLGLVRGRLFFAVMMEGGTRASVGDNEDEMIEIPSDTWVHVAGTYDGGALRLYVDGVFMARYTFNGKPAPPPDDVIVGSRFSGAIDEVRISKTVRAFSGLDRSRRGEEKLGLPNLALVQDLAARYDPARVTAKRIVTVGGAVAGHRAFDAFVAQRLGEGGGYVLADKDELTGGRVGVDDGLSALRARLENETPEIVRVCFGPYDIAKGKAAGELKPRLEELARLVLDRGAVPVLYTLPMPIIPADRGGMAINDFNQMVRELARDLRVPCLDAHMVLNDPGARGKNLTPTGAPTRDGYEALAGKFVELYRDLEYWVMARGADRVTDVAAADAAAAELAAESVAREPRPKGNLVVNGGFEAVDERSNFARGWTSHQWGPPSAKHSCRVDRTERHAGDRSLVIRGLTEGAKSGAFTSVSLHEGPYEVRFWVSADVDEGQGVKVFCHLGGYACDTVEIGAKWTKVVHRVEVEDRQLTASLRLWTTAVRVRVWIDDVEVEAVE